MLTSIAGDGFVLHTGEEGDFEDAEAIRLVAAGAAVPVSDEKLERALKAPTERRKAKR
jgi:hypothetical protein